MNFFIVLMIIVVFILLGYLKLSEKISEKERIKGLSLVATRMNCSFLRQKDTEFVGRLQDFYLFSQGDSRKVTNVIQGTVNDIDFFFTSTSSS